MSDDQDQAIRDIFKGAGVVYTGLLLEIFISFLAQVFAARYLTTADFGGITTGVALLNIGAIIGALGLNEGLVRHLPRHGSRNRLALIRIAYLIVIPASVILGILVSLNAVFIAETIFGDPTVTTSVRIFGAAIPFASVLMLSIGGIRGQEVSRYRVYVENIIRPTMRFGLVIGAVILGLGQAGFALAYALPYAFGAAIAVWLLTKTFEGSVTTVGDGPENVFGFLRYSLPMTVSRAANFVYRSADIFLLLFFLNASAVGAYGVAYAAARLVGMFSMAFNFLGAPISSRIEAASGPKAMVEAHQPVFRWLVLLSIPAMAPLILFPEPFIKAVYRPRYAPGAGALLVLAVTFAFDNVFNAIGNLLRGLGKSRALAVNGVVAAVTNVVFNIILIPEFGIIGAAIATLLSYLILDSLMTLEMWYFSGSFPVSVRVITPAFVGVPLVLGAWLVRDIVPTSLPGLVAFGAVFALTYGIAVIVLLGFEPEDVMLIRSIEESLGIKPRSVEWVLRRFS